jgi:hypothetical protein
MFSTLLDAGNACRVILVQLDVRVRSPNGRLRLVGDLKKQLGDSQFGVTTSPLYKGVPLLDAFFRNTRLFYWLVPEAEARDAFADVLASLERTLASADKAARGYLRREARLADFRVHTATVTVDREGEWRESGAAALAGLHAAVPARDASGARSVHILASPEFKQSLPPELKIPQRLADAGL